MLKSCIITKPVTPSPIKARWLSTKPYHVFDRAVKLKQRQRAARNPHSEAVQYLRNETASRTIERLAFIKRKFNRVLDFGSGSGNFARELCEGQQEDRELVRERVGEITMADSCPEMLNLWVNDSFNESIGIKRVIVDEENGGSEFKAGSFDAVISNLALHWVNDLPAVLQGLNRVLKPDGLLLASMISTDSLYELRTALQLAESERRGGISPRVSPLVQQSDISSLLRQSKFNLVTIDVDEIVVDYPDLISIMEDLQLMGEQNAINSPPGPLSKDLLLSTEAIYRSFHGNRDGTLPLTFRVLFMIGWKESEGQPKPMHRGSGEFNLKDALT